MKTTGDRELRWGVLYSGGRILLFGSHSFPPFFAALAFFFCVLCFSYSLFCSSQKSQVHSWNASHHNSSNINFRSFLSTCIPPPPPLSLSHFLVDVCVCVSGSSYSLPSSLGLIFVLLLSSLSSAEEFLPTPTTCGCRCLSCLRRTFWIVSLNSDTPLSLVTIAESPWRAKGEHRVVVADWETRRGWPLLIIEMVDFKNSSHQ